jgi:hypothetical protein
MHIHNWYHSDVTGIHYVHERNYNIHGAIPLLFLPLLILFCPLSDPLYLLGNPPSCDRIRPPWSQVACKLTSPFSTLSQPSPLQIPRTQVINRLTMTTSRIRLLLSGTVTLNFSFPGQLVFNICGSNNTVCALLHLENWHTYGFAQLLSRLFRVEHLKLELSFVLQLFYLFNPLMSLQMSWIINFCLVLIGIS